MAAPDLLKQIENRMITFSKSQKLIANYISEHYDKAAFMTASKLGKAVGISESTVVRFATELGFEGYPELQKELQGLIRNRLTSVQRMEVSDNVLGEQNIISGVLNSDIGNIKNTLENIDNEEFAKVVDTIISANRIYILGLRSSYALSSFLGFYFNIIFSNVRLITTSSSSELFEQIMDISENDVIIGISFPRYSQRTVRALSYACDKKAKVIAITDTIESPCAKYADHKLIARSDMASLVDSLVAPLSLINALIVAITLKKKQDVRDRFENLEKIWEEYGVYQKSNSDIS